MTDAEYMTHLELLQGRYASLAVEIACKWLSGYYDIENCRPVLILNGSDPSAFLQNKRIQCDMFALNQARDEYKYEPLFFAGVRVEESA